MKAAIQELSRFNRSLYPEQKIYTYVPPSNILCEEARSWLAEEVPDLRVIASVYLPDVKVPAYVQELLSTLKLIPQLYACCGCWPHSPLSV